MNRFLEKITSLFRRRNEQLEIAQQVMDRYTQVLKDSNVAPEYTKDKDGRIYLKGVALIQRQNSQRVR